MSKSLTARRLTAAALTVGALTAALAVPATAADHDHDRRAERQSVEISRVQYDSPGRDTRSNRSLNKEWVEITNNSRRAVNLDGWTLKDEDGHTYIFRHYRLDGRATVRVHTGQGRDTGTDLYQDRRHYVWDNRSDTATLRNDHRRFIDSESWGHHRHGGRH
ncbi:lamin tail domain-containing protein [Streptomyces sp. E5N298]|uniref:lamin tail domain-containing protein n=1 Tax=Streptomyces sp. E5N298 TaxID=1851983 RepID=UPI001EE8FD04|nr:lamin tail domain-containing protein [Streptomyces sp. E5N298]